MISSLIKGIVQPTLDDLKTLERLMVPAIDAICETIFKGVHSNFKVME